MANKRYDEFAAAAADPLRIWLHADPATGELKKATMAELTGCLFSQSPLINANNNGTNPQTLGQITVPAAMFDEVGSYVEGVYLGEILSTTGPPTCAVRIAGTEPVSMAGTATGIFRHFFYIQRISTTQIKAMVYVIRVLTLSGVSSFSTISLAQGNDLVIEMRNNAGGANTMFYLGGNARAYNN